MKNALKGNVLLSREEKEMFRKLFNEKELSTPIPKSESIYKRKAPGNMIKKDVIRKTGLALWTFIPDNVAVIKSFRNKFRITEIESVFPFLFSHIHGDIRHPDQVIRMGGMIGI